MNKHAIPVESAVVVDANAAVVEVDSAVADANAAVADTNAAVDYEKIAMTFLDGFYDTDPIYMVMEQCIAVIRDDAAVKANTEAYRRNRNISNDLEQPGPARSNAKRLATKAKHALPVLIPPVCCEGGKSLESVTRLVPVMAIDQDHITPEQVAHALAKLRESHYTWACEPSPSGEGVRSFYKIKDLTLLQQLWDAARPSERLNIYRHAWQQLADYVSELTGIPADEGCAKPTQPYSLAHCDDPYYNPDAEPFEIDMTTYEPPRIGHSKRSSLSQSKTVHEAALSDVESIILQRLKDDGRSPENGRNVYLHHFASHCNHYGVPQDEVVAWALAAMEAPDFDETEIRAAIESAYKRIDEYGTKQARKAAKKKYSGFTIGDDGHVSVDENLRLKLETAIVRDDEVFDAEEYLFSVDDVPFLSSSDIHTIGAKQKAGKTSLIGILISAARSGQWHRVKCLVDDMKVLYIDTEMKRSDTSSLMHKSSQTGGNDTAADNVIFTNFRPLLPQEMEQGLPFLIDQHRPKLVIVDGIVDFCANFNDVEHSQNLVVNYLMKIAEHFKCGIICVIHTNKTDDYSNLRGHLGAFLEQKGATVIKCEKDEVNNIATVTIPTYRKTPVPSFAFTWNADGEVVPADTQKDLIDAQVKRSRDEQKAAQKQERHAARRQVILDIINEHGGSVERKVLVDEAIVRIERKKSTVDAILQTMLKEQPQSIVSGGNMIMILPGCQQ